MTDKPFYRFFAIDYLATGEGRSYWLQICRNYQLIDRDRQFEQFAKFVPDDHYLHGCDELTEEEFMEKYAKLIPEYVKEQVNRRDQPIFTWQTHSHINYC